MSLTRRLALLKWARDAGAAIVEDDYDSEFRFDGRPIEPLHMLDTRGQVIYVGSFSKTMLPTLRLGFLLVPPSLLAALRSAKHLSDWHAPLALQATMARFIEDGLFARHIRRMRVAYEVRHRAIGACLANAFADDLEVIDSSVGMHIAALARKHSVERMAAVARRALSFGVECAPLAMFAVGDARRAGLMLGYGAIGREHIGDGLAALRKAFDAEARNGD